MFEPHEEVPKKKFTVVGIVTSIEYQKCKFYVQRLVKGFPEEYDPPVFRPMLNVQWQEYLLMIHRTIGGKTWTLEKNAAVFLDDEFIGDDMALFNYSINKGRMRITEDFYCLGVQELVDVFNKAIDLKRKFAYLTISVDDRCIGTLLFLLYSDHVPRTVKRFLRRCKSKKNGWVGRPIHRIVKGCWLQMGGFDLQNRPVPCENYIVPHDRRGVLSTCHEEKHVNNTTQVNISFAPTPWMDCKYVAFGQLIQGEEVLKRIESIETDYEAPKKKIIVTKCGEFSLDMSPYDEDTEKEILRFLERVNPETGLPDDVLDPRDVPSDLSIDRYEQGLYCHIMDLEPHPALNQWYLYWETAREKREAVAIEEYVEPKDTGDDDVEKMIRHILSADILGRIGTGPKTSKLDVVASAEALRIVGSIIDDLIPGGSAANDGKDVVEGE